MGGELNTIIAEKLGNAALGDNNLYRMKIIESLFVHSENVYRKYEYGAHVKLRSNNLCNTIYSSIKLICDENPLSFPFLLSYFYDKDIFEVIKDELIGSLTDERYKNPQLRSNVERYLQSDKNIKAQNDFLYSVYSDDQAWYRTVAPTIIENKVKDYVTGLTAKEVQYIYRKVSDKVENFDYDKNKREVHKFIIALGVVCGFMSSLSFIGSTELSRISFTGKISVMIIVPFLIFIILSKLLNCTRSYDINDDFKDLNTSFAISIEALDSNQISPYETPV